MKRFLLVALAFIGWIFACNKGSTDKSSTTVYTPVPFLTGKLWALDTITINPPASYNQLSAPDQTTYNRTLAWEKTGEMKFNENGTVECGGGNWDFGYNKWQLIHNNLDIEMQMSTGKRDTLFDWTADNLHFTYRKSFSPSFDCTFIFH